MSLIAGSFFHRAKIDSSIICSNVRIGEKAQVQASELGNGYEVEADGEIVHSHSLTHRLLIIIDYE